MFVQWLSNGDNRECSAESTSRLDEVAKLLIIDPLWNSPGARDGTVSNAAWGKTASSETKAMESLRKLRDIEEIESLDEAGVTVRASHLSWYICP